MLDRYSLALEMLEKSDSAREILADLLEEQGDTELAQWARSSRFDSTLNLILRILPCDAVTEMGGVLIQRGFPEFASIRFLAIFQEWCLEEKSDASTRAFKERIRKLIPSSPGVDLERLTKLRGAMHELMETMNSATEYSLFLGERHSEQVHRWHRVTAEHVQRIAELAGNARETTRLVLQRLCAGRSPLGLDRRS